MNKLTPSLGTPSRLPLPKRMNFRKSSKRPLNPRPLIFGKSYCNFFLKFMSSIVAEICNIIFWIENDPPSFGTFPKIHPYWSCQASHRAQANKRFLFDTFHQWHHKVQIRKENPVQHKFLKLCCFS